MEREPQTNDYLATLLADMEAKKAALDAAMVAIRAAIVAGALGAPGDYQPAPTSAGSTVQPAGFADLPRGAFLGKSATEAIKLYLSTVRRKQTNKEIAQALRDGGLESAGDFGNYITSALFRLKKEGTLLRFDDGWGLSEWYNEAFRAKVGGVVTKKPAKRAKARHRKVTPKKETAVQPSGPESAPTAAPAPRPRLEPRPITHAAPEASTAPPTGIDARVMELLNFPAPNGTASKDLAGALRVQGGVVNFSLVRLIKKGVVRRGDDGNYYAVKEP